MGAGYAGGEVVTYADADLGLALDLPAGFSAYKPTLAGVTAPAVAVLTWPAPPWSALRVSLWSRAGRFESPPALAAQLVRGLDFTPATARLEPLAAPALDAAGADGGVAAVYEDGAAEPRRVRVLVLAAGERRYRVAVDEAALFPEDAAVESMLRTVKLLPASDAGPEIPVSKEP